MVQYLVYMTTDVNTGKFYIGKHNSHKQNDSYVGSGVWVKKCKKSGVNLVKSIAAKCQSENEAYKFEKTLVSACKKQYPNLCMNFADGGRGSIASNMVGRNPPMLGKKHKEESKRKIGKWSKENKSGKKHHMYGKKHSDLAKLKMSQSHKNIAHLRGKKVLCKNNGIIFNTLVEAAIFVNNNPNSRSNIRNCCNGKTKQSYGYQWQFVY